jgi:hypothetical protein
MLRGSTSYKESDRLHSKKGRYKHLDEDPLSAPPVYKNLTSLPSEPSLGSSEQLQNLLKQYGLVTDNELPISELISMFAAPAIAARAGKKVIHSIPDAMLSPNSSIADFINSLMRRSPTDQLNPIK